MMGDFANNFAAYVLLSEVLKILPALQLSILDARYLQIYWKFQSPAFFKGLLPLGKDKVLLGKQLHPLIL